MGGSDARRCFPSWLAFPILGLAAGQGFNHLAGKLVGFGGKLEGSRRSTPESQLSVLACWRAFKPWPARGLALADGLVVDLEGLQDLGFADSGACPAHRQGDAPSLLPSPANNIDFNSMTGGAAVPRSVSAQRQGKEAHRCRCDLRKAIPSILRLAVRRRSRTRLFVAAKSPLRVP